MRNIHTKIRHTLLYSAIVACSATCLLACSGNETQKANTSNSNNPVSASVESESTAKDQERQKIRNVSGLYLQVLEDLWKTDEGLNENLKYISVDLSNAPGNLSKTEKDNIAKTFAKKHGAKALTYSYEELVEKDYVNEYEGWSDGVLFVIEKSKGAAGKFEFDAEKWRGPDGADYWENCTVKVNNDGTWKSYKVGSFSVS